MSECGAGDATPDSGGGRCIRFLASGNVRARSSFEPGSRNENPRTRLAPIRGRAYRFGAKCSRVKYPPDCHFRPCGLRWSCLLVCAVSSSSMDLCGNAPCDRCSGRARGSHHGTVTSCKAVCRAFGIMPGSCGYTEQADGTKQTLRRVLNQEKHWKQIANSFQVFKTIGGDDGTRTRGLCRDSEIFNRN